VSSCWWCWSIWKWGTLWSKMTLFSNRTIWRCGDASVHMPEVTLRSLHGWKSLGSRGVRALFTLFPTFSLDRHIDTSCEPTIAQ
jgi:hypothetical protein